MTTLVLYCCNMMEVRYLQSINTAYKEHHRRRGESESSNDGDEEESESGSDIDDEEATLDPDEELHIPEVEDADDDFDEWFARHFPAFPEEPVPQRRARRRR